MVHTRRGLVFSTCILSGIAMALSLVSFGTEEWVTAQGEFTLEGMQSERLSSINYGLFYGTFEQVMGTSTFYEIAMTCAISDNSCALICDATAEDRLNQLLQLINGQNPSFDVTCPRVVRIMDGPPLRLDSPRRDPRAAGNYTYLSAGLYISTVFFLALSVFFGLISTGLAIWNTVSNPVETYLSIYGLYVYNSIACCACIMTLSLWGAQFGTVIADNVGILLTINGQMDSQGLSYLGYSYWINIPSAVLYAGSVMVLFIRQYLIEQEPRIKIHATEGNQDVGKIMIY